MLVKCVCIVLCHVIQDYQIYQIQIQDTQFKICFWCKHESASVSCSIVSNSLWPCGLWPTRLLCPWNFPGKNTGVGCYSFFQGIFLTRGSNSGLLQLSKGHLQDIMEGNKLFRKEGMEEGRNRKGRKMDGEEGRTEIQPWAEVLCQYNKVIVSLITENHGCPFAITVVLQLFVSGFVLCLWFSQWFYWEPLDSAPDLPLLHCRDSCRG